VIFGFSFTALSQEFGSNVIGVEKSGYQKESKGFNPNVSVSLGTSFTSFAPGFNMFGTFIMPEFELPVSKKFSVSAGFGYSRFFISNPEQSGNLFQQENHQLGIAYISGLYHVNSKLSIAGTASKTFELAPVKNELNPHALDFSNEGVRVNIDYKVTDHFRINAGFSYQKGNPYFYYPEGNIFNPSPFFNNDFSPEFRY
jgi:hypothetical protein